MAEPAALPFSIDPEIAAYLASGARQVPLLDARGEGERDSTGFVRAVLDAVGGDALPVLAGYRLGPVRASAFSGASRPCVAVAADGVGLRPSARGVDAMHGAGRALYADSVTSALRRLVERDRAARVGFPFRIHAPVGAQVAQLLDCSAVSAWSGFYRGELAVVDEVLRRTDVDCLSLEAARVLLEAAEQRDLPIFLREDATPTPRDAPTAPPSFTFALGPRDAFDQPRPRDGWDGAAYVRFEGRGEAIVQTRFAFGAPVDVRVAVAGGVVGSVPVELLGSARVTAYLLGHRASRLGALAAPDAVVEALEARGLAHFAGAAAVDARAGALVGAGLWGGAVALFVGPAIVLGAAGRGLVGELPAPLREGLVQPLGDSGADGLLVGWLVGGNELFVDAMGRLVSVDEVGDEHPRARGIGTLLEKLALSKLLDRRCEVAVVVDADVAVALAERLAVPRVVEASCEVTELFVANENDPTKPLLAVERCRFPRDDRSPVRCLIWAETPSALIAAAQIARELAPHATFGPADSFQASDERLDALRRAGFDAVGALPESP